MFLLWTPLALAADPDPVAVAEQLREAALKSTEAYDELAVMCDDIGHRLSGHEGLDKAVDWTAERMREDGLDVRKEPVTVKRWVRGKQHAVLLTPIERELNILTLGMSVGTPEGGITADVVVADSFEALEALGDQAKGKIVLFDPVWEGYGKTVSHRIRGADRAAAQGAVAMLLKSVSPNSLDTPHTGTLFYGEGVKKLPAAAVTHEAAGVMRRLYDRGEPVRVHLELGAHMDGERPSANVVGEVKGREKPDEVVVLGCHLDSWDVGQGAQDDGVGCTVMMEAAALIKALPTPPRRTVRVVLYVNEENGGAGGDAYRDAHRKRLDKHVAALESDTGSGQPTGWSVDVRRDKPKDAEKDLGAALQALGPIAELLAPLGAGDLQPGGSGADIGPIVAEGVLGLGLVHDMTNYWPIHHTRADTIDKIEPDLVAKNVATVAITAWMLAELEASALP